MEDFFRFIDVGKEYWSKLLCIDIISTNETQLHRILSAYLLSYRRTPFLDVLGLLLVLYR
jgi:hypothetical protein